MNHLTRLKTFGDNKFLTYVKHCAYPLPQTFKIFQSEINFSWYFEYLTLRENVTFE
jgi:hypothetical protein